MEIPHRLTQYLQELYLRKAYFRTLKQEQKQTGRDYIQKIFFYFLK